MNPESHSEKQEPLSILARNRNLIKGFFISFLILALLIPTYFIGNIIDERKQRNEDVKKEIASQWSTDQTISGPVLVIPYLIHNKASDGKISTIKQFAYFLPDELIINGNLLPDFRARSSIFKLLVYTANLSVSGKFSPLAIFKLNILQENLLLNEAFLTFGLSDYTGIQEKMKINWDGKEYDFNAGINSADYIEKGLHTPIQLSVDDLNKDKKFSMKMMLRGSEQIQFIPLGKSTTVSVDAAWPHPDFKGKTLPERVIKDGKFAAIWKAFDLNREFPQQWKSGAKINFQSSAFGVKMLQPLDNYGKATRTIKYAILVIMLTFVVYFFIEVMQKKQVHAVQYVLIGFALCLFYTLMLSISEYTSYSTAYLISAVATVLLISVYTRSVFSSNKTAGIFGGFLSLLYVFIFVLIQLQDGALLAGSIGLFIILAAIMYFSRKIDWHGKG
ncbi:MAG TPA: cell envelope integrity protein CreD [Chitinophagaceae bacterium]|nr:cell envelope integrity protein CreD [Chitinophagaceae bacterium]